MFTLTAACFPYLPADCTYAQAWSMKDLGISSVAQDQGSFVAGSLLALKPMSNEAITAMQSSLGQLRSMLSYRPGRGEGP